MVTIYAEKFDVGVKIAAALGGFDYEGTRVTMNNVEKLKQKLDKDVKKKGAIYIEYQGTKYAVTWGQGHLCSLKQAKDYNPEYAQWKKMPMPFFPQSYEIKIREGYDYKTKKPTGANDAWAEWQLNIVKSLFEKSEYIINATDDDREGELIFAYVYELLGVNKPYKRVILDSQTEEGFRYAFAHLKNSDEVRPIENAGRGRSVADWIVGANLTALMSLKYGGGGADSLISIGRVQTPVLNILVERELAIRNFKSHPFWYVSANFTTENGDTYTGKHEIAQIEDKSKADELLAKVMGKPGVITDYVKEKATKEVPLLYNLTNLSQAANKAYGFTAAQTLEIAQWLYEHGYTTYPRTPSTCLTDDMQTTVDEVLDMLCTYDPQYKNWIEAVPKSQRNYTKRHFNTKKVESHYAIIPTKVKPEGLNDNQKKLYDLIAKSLIRIIYKPAVLEKTKVVTTVEGENFKSSGTVIVEEQWLVVDSGKKDDDILPILTKGQNVSGNYELKEGKTNPPQRFTDDTLLTAMKTAGKQLDDEELKAIMESERDGGIGTEATRAGIIETVIARKYAERSGKQIIPTEKGMKLIEILPLSEIKSAEITAKWETRLKAISERTDTLDSFIHDIQEQTAQWVKQIQSLEVTQTLSQQKNDNDTGVACPVCGKPMKKYSWGWACSGYQKDNPDACKFAISYKIGGSSSIKDSDIDDLITKKKTKFIPDFKTKDGKEYGAFLILTDENKIDRTWDTGYECPICHNHQVTAGLAKGQVIWSCSGWKDGCSFTIWPKIAGKTISDSDKIALLTKGKTKVIKGFTGSKGKFDAALKVGDDGKITFDFEKKEKK